MDLKTWREERVEMDGLDPVKSWSCGTSRRERNKQIGGSEFVRIGHSTFCFPLLCQCFYKRWQLGLPLLEIESNSTTAPSSFDPFFFLSFFTVGFQFSLLKLPLKGCLWRFWNLLLIPYDRREILFNPVRFFYS